MISLYQQHLLINLEQYTTNFGSNFNANISTIFFSILFSEVILFVSLIILILNLGWLHNTCSKPELLISMKEISYWGLQLSFIALIFQFVIFFNNDWSVSYHVFQGTYIINIFTQIFKIIITLIALILYQYLDSLLLSKHTTNVGELPLLFHISVFLTFIIISCGHYAILLLALEGFSLTLYILTTIDRSHGGIIASVKYFTFGTFGSILLFWGVAHYYALFPNLLYTSIAVASECAIMSNLSLTVESYNFAGITIMLGLLIKLGAAPIHQWVPDVYSGASLVITALFATIVKIVIFIIICSVALYTETTFIIFIFAICSLVIGSFITLRQVEVKRFLAYSSISHVGFILIGDLPSSYIYLITYICSSLLFFSVLLSVRINNRELIYLMDFRLIKKSGLWNTFLLMVSLASMAGLPPFSGFFGKFLVWGSLIEDIYLYNSSDSYFLLIISISLTLITIFYYMRFIAYIYISNDNETNAGTFTLKHNASQPVLAIIIVFWFFFQPKLMTIITYINYIMYINTLYLTSLKY